MTHGRAARLIEEGRADEALPILSTLLDANPGDVQALSMTGLIHAQAGRYGMAHALYAQAVAVDSGHAASWNGVGMALDSMHRHGAARRAFRRAQLLRPAHPPYVANEALTWLHDGDPAKAASIATQALAIDPTHVGAQITRGFAQLQMGEWAAGWPGFSKALGGTYRMRIDYGLPEWEGQADAHVIVHGEQGLGDEVMFASCLPDVVALARAVTVDCDSRLVGLFARSFPSAEVYGTRARADKFWLDDRPTHQIAIGELPRLFRPTPASCPGTAYLLADPDRVAMYDALQARHSGGRRRLGVAWAAGTDATGAKRRRFDPALLAPLQDRAALFSLEYNDPGQVPGIYHCHRAVGRGADYDETAAYIAALGAIVTVDTTAAHAAGALGVPTVVLVHDACNWVCGPYQGGRSAWYESVRYFRQLPGEAWAQTLARFLQSEELATLLEPSP